ncbi:MAG: Tat pathway signal sequence protein [Ferruginibacter sp.]|nr:Tat pathway signal sequence protein [Ferruginibacter sp.]
MTDRRNFVKQISTAGLLGAIPNVLLSEPHRFAPQQKISNDKIWACLLHLSYNFWVEYSTPSPFRGYRPYLQLSESLWNDAAKKMVDQGINMVVIDLGDGVKYESHPEIAVNNAWSTSRLRQELAKFRKMGIEPIPKLNFAAGHDIWLGKYSRMVSTDIYYGVCKDLIKEVAELFDHPRFFHLGMDEENAEDQKWLNHVVIRQHDLWWHDFYFFVEQVERSGCRSWIWSDYLWKHPEEFFNKMPKSVIQSNWYYEESFDEKLVPVKAYMDLESKGYDQIPTGGYYKKSGEGAKNMGNTVEFSNTHIADPRLLGFLQTFWAPTTEENRGSILKAIGLLGESKKWYDTHRIKAG